MIYLKARSINKALERFYLLWVNLLAIRSTANARTANITKTIIPIFPSMYKLKMKKQFLSTAIII